MRPNIPNQAGWTVFPRARALPLLLLGALLSLSACTTPATPPAPVRGSVLYNDGARAYQSGKPELAAKSLRAAIQENPDLVMARFLLAQIHREKGDYSAAVEQYQRVADLDPSVFTNHYNLGLMYHLLSRLQEAVTAYLQAIRLNPNDLKSNMYLGMVYAALGQPDLGLPYVQKACELDPRSGEAFANLGVVLDGMRQYTAAEMAYRRAVELSPDRLEVALNLAGCLISQNRHKDAANIFEELLRTQDSSLLRQRYGAALLQLGQPDEAITQFRLALKLNPRNHRALAGLGDAHLAQYRASAMLDEPKRTAALTYWRQSLSLNPQQPQLQALIAEYSAKTLFPE